MIPTPRPRLRLRSSAAFALAALSVAVCPALVRAQTYSYQGAGGTTTAPVSGVFSTGFTPAFTTPTGTANVLQFGTAAVPTTTNYAATNDLGTVNVLTLTLNPGAGTTASIEQNAGVGTINFSGAAATNVPTVTQNGPGAFNVNNPVTAAVGTGSSVVPNQVNLTGSGAGTVTFGSTFTLGATQLLKQGTSNYIINGAVTANGSTAATQPVNVQNGSLTLNGTGNVFNGGANNPLQSIGATAVLNLNGTTSGTSGLVAGNSATTAGGTINVTAANSQAGAVTVNGSGVLNVSGANGALTGTGAITLAGGTLNLNNATDNNAARLADTKALTLTGGSFNFTGNAAGTTEVFGNVAFNSAATTATAPGPGFSNLTLVADPAGAAILRGGNLARGTNGVGLARGTNLGTAAPGTAGVANLQFTGTLATVGSTATTGTATRVFPYLLADTSATGTGAGFATYEGTGATAVGVRLLNAATEAVGTVAASMTATTGDNVISSTAETGLGSSTVNSLQLNAGGSVGLAAGATLTVASGGVLGLPGNGGITGGTLAFGANQGIVFAQGAATDVTTVSSAVTGTAGLVKAGTGTLALTGSLAGVTGGVLVNNGPLDLTGNASALPAANAVNVGSGGTLTLGSSNNLQGNVLTLAAQNATVNLNGANAVVSALTSTASGNASTSAVNLGAGILTVNNAAAGTFAGAFTAAAGGSFVKNGVGAFTLQSTAAQSFALANTVINAGTFRLTDPNVASTLPTLTTTLTINSGGTATFDENNSGGAASGLLAGSASQPLTINAGGTFNNGKAVTVIGTGGVKNAVGNAQPVVINGGTFGFNRAFGSGGSEATGPLTLGAGNGAVRIRVDTVNIANALTPTSVSRLNNATLTVVGTNLGQATTASTSSGRLFLTGVAASTGAGTTAASVVPYLIGGATPTSTTATGVPAGEGTDFVFNNLSTAGGNTNTGVRLLAAAESNTTLNDSGGAITNQENYRLTANGTVANPSQIGTLNLVGSGVSVTGGGTLTVNTNSVGANASGIIAQSGATGNTISTAGLAFGGKEAIFHVLDGAAADDLTVSSAITGTGGLTKSSLGTMVLSGNNAGLSGEITVNAGTLRADAAGALPAGQLVRVTQQGTLNLNGNSLTTAGLTDGVPTSGAPAGSTLRGGTVALGAGTLTFGATAVTQSFSGQITGTGGIAKSGSGTQVLNPNFAANVANPALFNTFTGATTVSAGNLVAAANGALATTSGITVGSGGTLTLTGSSTALAIGDTLSAAPVTDRIGNAVGITLGTAGVGGGTLVRSGVNASEGSNGTVGLGILSLVANSTLDFTTGDVGTLNFAGYSAGGFNLDVIGYEGAASGIGVDGINDRLLFGVSLTGGSGGQVAGITFSGSPAFEIPLGNGFFEVSPVPEPSTYALLGLGLAGLGFAVARRRRQGVAIVG